PAAGSQSPPLATAGPTHGTAGRGPLRTDCRIQPANPARVADVYGGGLRVVGRALGTTTGRAVSGVVAGPADRSAGRAVGRLLVLFRRGLGAAADRNRTPRSAPAGVVVARP